ncbi:MAG: ferrous iron transport protein B [candidate division KSB1 bacterium]|nr:ferrous iron transport protein B [candidate division KSB1 bacterium]MDZ7273877.1 ferrous iron transport protein B [candidate division KSB1 bacterium]MDZ7286033.1 ferrous iron transport protein B [candidate division KSB1 bacterium]MDZ7299065.1 ferrous iron transport protein B [candidate division KSB1 bacterium]MDZ7308202.1 ferrous iron transport protein B [candidate division KSB1 bacterium]
MSTISTVQHAEKNATLVHRARVLLVGNPNSGKTTLFNALTGLRQKVANYPGVTVEKKVGVLAGPGGGKVELHDLPGLYSLNPRSLDERIAVAEITARPSPPDLIVVVADATNLERNLYLAVQILDLGLPTLLVLNMIDEAERHAIHIDVAGLADKLGVPVLAASAKKGTGVAAIRRAIFAAVQPGAGVTPGSWQVPRHLAQVCKPVVGWFQANGSMNERRALAEALRVISDEDGLQRWAGHPYVSELRLLVDASRETLAHQHIPWRQTEAAARYDWIDQLLAANVRHGSVSRLARSEKIDQVLTHRVFGPLILIAVLLLMFQAIFTWAEIPMGLIEDFFAWLQQRVTAALPPGVLADLLVNGAIAGVGAVVVFLPQILLLVFFLALLEESGYLARAAFMLDRFMARIGLQGHSVIPLLSAFACAIPGIMAARTIKNPQDRLITILVAPLMSCSARLPVYTLMIAAFIPNLPLLGFLSLQGVTLFALYLLGIVTAITAAYLLKRFLIKGQVQAFVMELPAYRMPSPRTVLWQMYERARVFVMNAGRVILAISIVLWFLASYPKSAAPADELLVSQQTTAGTEILNTYAGRLGKFIEPAIAPLGFDWKIGIGLITSFAAREVMVSTLATIYNVQEADERSVDLRRALQADRNPATGAPVYTPLVALSLMVFFVLACQCMSTVAIVRRETGTWRWPLFMITYMTVLAYLGALAVFQGGKLIGLE